MRGFFALTLAVGLAACNSAPAEDTAAAPEAAETEAMTTPEPAAAAGVAPAAGSYTVVDADGTESPFTMNADGTWTGTDAEGKPAKGTYKQEGGKTCFTSDPPSEDDTCWTSQPAAADGSFSSTSDKGRTVTVKVAA